MFSLFGFGKRKVLTRKRNPRVYKRKSKKYFIKNGKKTIRLPVQTKKQAVKTLVDRFIYTKAKREPYSTKRKVLLREAPSMQSSVDKLVQLKLLEFLNKPPIAPAPVLALPAPAPVLALPAPQQAIPIEQKDEVSGPARADIRKEVSAIMKDESIPITERERRAREFVASVRHPDIPAASAAQIEEDRVKPSMEDVQAGRDRRVDAQLHAEDIAGDYYDATGNDYVGDDGYYSEPEDDSEDEYIEQFKTRQRLKEIAKNEAQQAAALAEGNIPAFLNETEQIYAQMSELASELEPEAKAGKGVRNKDEDQNWVLNEGRDFRPELLKGDPLYDKQIESIMKADPRFLKVIARDEILSLVPLAKHATDAYGKFGFIMNLDSRAQSSKEHWVSVYCDPIERKEICYYDPFGEPPIYEKISTDLKKLVAALDLPYSLKYKINMIPNQELDSNRCGIHSMLFLDKMFSGIPFSEATNYSVYKSELEAKNTEGQLKKFGLI